MADRTNQSLERRLGGATRKRVVLILAGVLALNGANGGAVGAMAAQLEPAFHVGNTALGLLVTGASLVGATASIPVGVLADRTSRTRLIALGIGCWMIAIMVSGLAGSYLMLLLTQLAVGAMAAVAGPTVASLIGDLFAPAERGRIYAFILTGELAGAGFGIVVAGDVGAAISWRAGFFLLALPGIALLWALHRYLPEPARGGQARLLVGADHLVTAADVADGNVPPKTVEEIDCGIVDTTLAERVAGQGIEPDAKNVLSSDPASLGLGRAVHYILGIRTNILLIVASSVGYFFFAGVRTFAVLFITRRFALPEAVATLMVPLVGAGAIVGIWLGGKVSDRLLGRGQIDARIVVGAVGYVIAALLFLPSLLVTSLFIALPLFIGAAAALGAPNPALDSARLDIMPARLWGRAEAVRTVVRSVLESAAPLLFGFVSEQFEGGPVSLGATANPSGAHVRQVATSAANAHGLDLTFLIMLVPLAASGVIVWRARRCYPGDVAAAAASEIAAADPIARPPDGSTGADGAGGVGKTTRTSRA